MPAIVQVIDLIKHYYMGDVTVEALRGVNLAFDEGDFVALMGPSGSGKSTLMNVLGCLDRPTAGQYVLRDQNVADMTDDELSEVRSTYLGFIFQAYNLLPQLTAAENITLPQALAGRKPDQAWLDTIIDTVRLRDRLHHRPSELSGGQQQRVAVARALAGRPEIVFADEPTGNLDSRAGAEILGFMRQAVRELGQTIVMVTHDPTSASYASRVVFLEDGRIVDELQDPSAEQILDRLKAFGDT